MTFELFTHIMLGITIVIAPLYFLLMRLSKNSWITSSHDTQGGSMTIVKDTPNVTYKDPIIKKK